MGAAGAAGAGRHPEPSVARRPPPTRHSPCNPHAQVPLTPVPPAMGVWVPQHRQGHQPRMWPPTAPQRGPRVEQVASLRGRGGGLARTSSSETAARPRGPARVWAPAAQARTAATPRAR